MLFCECPHFFPTILSPVALNAWNEIFGHSAMRQYQVRPAVFSGREVKRCHRKNANRKLPRTPSLYQALARNEFDIDAAYMPSAGRESPADLLANDSLLASKRCVMPRINKQLIDSFGTQLEFYFLFYGFAHLLAFYDDPIRILEIRGMVMSLKMIFGVVGTGRNLWRAMLSSLHGDLATT